MNTKNIFTLSLKGFLFTSYKSIFVNLFKFASVLILSKYLQDKDYGTFAIINSWIVASFFLTDAGTNDLHLQMKESPTKEMFQTSSFIHLFLSFFYMILFISLSKKMQTTYNLPDEARWMIICLAIMIPILALRQVPKIVLERDFSFKKIMVAEVIESFFLYLVQIVLAVLGVGVWSLIAGTLFKTIFGTILIIYFAKKIYLPKFNKKAFLKMIPDAWPFQASLILNAVSALSLPIILGTNASLALVGLTTWSMSLASFPMAFAFNFYRVLFPSLSQLTGDEIQLKKLASQSLEISFLFFSFIFALGASCSWGLMKMFFSEKWLPSLDFFYLAIFWAFTATISYLLGTIVNAKKLQKTRFKAEIVFTLGSCLLSFIGIKFGSIKGYLVGLSVSQILISAFFYYKIQEVLRIQTLKRLLLSLVISTSTYFINYKLFSNALLIVQFLAFSSAFCFLFFVLDNRAVQDVKLLYKKIRS